jgi:hypothetical protein
MNPSLMVMLFWLKSANLHHIQAIYVIGKQQVNMIEAMDLIDAQATVDNRGDFREYILTHYVQ